VNFDHSSETGEHPFEARLQGWKTASFHFWNWDILSLENTPRLGLLPPLETRSGMELMWIQT
jgi:hypothetical protein